MAVPAAAREPAAPASPLARVGAAIIDGVASSARSLRAVFAQPNLRRLELALAGSYFGYWAFGVALAVYAYRVGGAAGVGIATLTRTAGGLFGPFAGAIADRYERRRVLVAGELIRAATMAVAALLVTASAPAASVYAMGALLGIVQTVHRPATSAILPSLAHSPDDLTAANAVASTVESVSMFAGPALGGLLLAATNVETVFLATSAFMLVSGAMVVRIRTAEKGPEDEGSEEGGILRDTLVGFRTIAAEHRVALLLGIFSAQTLVAGALNVFIVVMALELFDAGASGVGFLNAAIGIGGLLGALGALGLSANRLAPSFVAGLLLWGAPLGLIAVLPHLPVALLMLLIVGIGNALVDVSGLTLLQRAVPDEVLARVFGVLESVVVLTIGLGGVLAPVVISALGTRGGLVAAALVLPALVALTWRPLQRLDAESRAATAELEVLRRLPIFAPLALPTLERLAAHLEPVSVPAGGSVFEQGEPGDRFYIVSKGEVEVSIDGAPVRREGPGESFGEIALLRGVPRTASVRALSGTQLYALTREEFLPAVSGHAESRDQADAIVASRLRHARPALASV